MTLTLILIGQPGEKQITNALFAPLKQALEASGARVSKEKTLSQGDAAEWQIEGLAATAISQIVADNLGGLPIDVAVVPSEGRKKQLLIADMDSTIITAECIDEIADVMGIRAEVASITERAMRGEIPFEGAMRERVALLKGLAAEKLQSVYDDRIELTTGARTLVQTMKAQGVYTALISGGFTYFTRRVASACGFDTHQGNTLEISDGALTGRVPEPILGREAKFDALVSLREQHGLDRSATLAVGDGANDLAMLSEAGLGIAFHAKPIVAAEAHCAINHTDLTSLLYIQGYTKDEFAE